MPTDFLPLRTQGAITTDVRVFITAAAPTHFNVEYGGYGSRRALAIRSLGRDDSPSYRTTPDMNPALRRGGLMSFLRKQCAALPTYPGRA